MTLDADPSFRTLVLALSALAWGACGGDTEPAVATVVDSAGVEIVTNLPGSIDTVEAWSLSAEPVVAVGSGASPEVPLHQVADVVPLEAGRVAVGTRSPPRALVFGPDGALEGTLGRKGQGPGEFASVGSVVSLGSDSLAVWDPHRRRLSVFTSDDGRHVRDVDLTDLAPPHPMAAGSMAEPAGFTHLLSAASGSLVVFVNTMWGPGTPESGVHRLERTSHRVDAGGEELATYGPFPGLEMYADPVLGAFPYPFGAGTHAVVSGDALVVGTAESPELRFYAPDGTLRRIVRWEGPDRTIARSRMVDEYTAWLGEQLAQRSPRERDLFREALSAVPRPEPFPAYRGLVSEGETGAIWVGEYPGQLGLIGLSPDVRRIPARRWLVFGPGGRLTATVETPAGFRPHAVGGDRVWGRFTDVLDVESVRAYEIEGHAEAGGR